MPYVKSLIGKDATTFSREVNIISSEHTVIVSTTPATYLYVQVVGTLRELVLNCVDRSYPVLHKILLLLVCQSVKIV